MLALRVLVLLLAPAILGAQHYLKTEMIMQEKPEQVIDLTKATEPVSGLGKPRYAEILTAGGTVRVNVNLIDIRTHQPCITVEVEPAGGWDALPGRRFTGDAEVKLLRRKEDSQ
jgi:hypothetical protein